MSMIAANSGIPEAPAVTRARMEAYAARMHRHSENLTWALWQCVEAELFPTAAIDAWRALYEQEVAYRACSEELTQLRRWANSPLRRQASSEERQAAAARLEQLEDDHHWYLDGDGQHTSRRWLAELDRMDWVEVYRQCRESPQRDAKAPNGETLVEWLEYKMSEKGLRPGDYVR
jgi:hypothetical protein